jgi:SAM-dependent methyltransferase
MHAFEDVDAQRDPARWIEVLACLGGDPLYRAYKSRIAELLAPRHGGTYLEVGAGTGADATAVQDRFGVTVVGVDAARTMVEEAGRRGLAHAVAADAHALPFDAATFDGAWADRVFQHLADPVAALGEMARVVKPGGTIVVADPDYATQVVNVPDHELAERVLRVRERAVRNGTLAHRMAGLFAGGWFLYAFSVFVTAGRLGTCAAAGGPGRIGS